MALVVLTLGIHEKEGLLVKGNEWEFEGASWQHTTFYPYGEETSQESPFTETVRLADLSKSGDSSQITLQGRKLFPATGTTGEYTVVLSLTRRGFGGYILKNSYSDHCFDVDFAGHPQMGFNPYFTKDTLLADHADGKKAHVVIKSTSASGLAIESEYLPGTGVVAAKYSHLLSAGGATGHGWWTNRLGRFVLTKFNGNAYDQVTVALRDRRRTGPDPRARAKGFAFGYDLLGRSQPPQSRFPAFQAERR